MAYINTPIGGGPDISAEVETQSGLIDDIKTALVGKATGANATADKIVEGYAAWVGGELIQGTAQDPLQLVNLKGTFGYNKIAIDKFTLTTQQYVRATSISHSLGEKPKAAMILPVKKVVNTINELVFAILRQEDWSTEYWDTCIGYYYQVATSRYGINCDSSSATVTSTAITWTTNSLSTYLFLPNIEYTMITLG